MPYAGGPSTDLLVHVFTPIFRVLDLDFPERVLGGGGTFQYNREVPAPGIQALLDSSVRNIWQAREIKCGLPAYQVGPTCYRSLWIGDGAFILEVAAILGAGDQARNGIATELRYQKDDGRIEVMQDRYGYWKENGIVLWTCVRHAQLTQDKAWLESVWPRLRRVADFIKIFRTDRPAPCKEKVIARAPGAGRLGESLRELSLRDGQVGLRSGQPLQYS